jgi:hypothetical protein
MEDAVEQFFPDHKSWDLHSRTISNNLNIF